MEYAKGVAKDGTGLMNEDQQVRKGNGRGETEYHYGVLQRTSMVDA